MLWRRTSGFAEGKYRFAWAAMSSGFGRYMDSRFLIRFLLLGKGIGIELYALGRGGRGRFGGGPGEDSLGLGDGDMMGNDGRLCGIIGD